MKTKAGTSEYLFVYGTLRNSRAHGMNQRLKRGAEFVGHGTMHALLFDLGEYPGAIMSDDDSDVVTGEVYRVRSPHRLLQELDRYEGCGPHDPKPTEFRRELVKVGLENGTRVSAWSYLYNLSSDGLRRIPSGDYLDFRRRTAQADA